ncbi:MAG: hypothetical protein Q9194_005271 [Teloschistes cf. exilis]
MAPVLEASKMPESRAEDHDTSSESSSKDMSEVAEVGSSTQHTPSPISASAVAKLEPLDSTVQLSDERVAAESQSRESSTGEARPIIEVSGIREPHGEHTGDVDDARSGHTWLLTPVQKFLLCESEITEVLGLTAAAILAVSVFLGWDGLLWFASQMIPPDRLRKCLEIMEALSVGVVYWYTPLRIIQPARLLELRRTVGPPLRKGMRRVRWKCSCGSKLYDDFVELNPGAAAQFESALNTPHQQRPSAPYGTAPGQDCYASSWPRDSGPSPGPLLPLSRTPNSAPAATTIGPNARNNQHSSATTVCEQESKWLLVCARAWRRPTSLVHLNVCSTSSDQQMFTELRRLYLQTKAWYHRFSLKAVQSIRFVQAVTETAQFELHPRDLVDIRKVPDMPSERRKDEYVYQACDLLPPVGENLMTHLFHHPHEANEKAITFLRSPKKRKQRLAVCPQTGTNLGWGIHLVEGYAMTRVWSLASGMFLISSMVFAVAWSVLEHDVQGAFAIAAYVVALVGLGVGTLQTYIA